MPDASRPWIKITASGTACDATAGTGDALAGGAGQLAYESATVGSVQFTVAVAALSTGNRVCSSDTQGGTYAALTAGDDTVDLISPPTVVSLTPTTIPRVSPTTLSFATTHLVDDSTRPWIKITAPDTACDAAAGTGDALAGGAGQLAYESATVGSVQLTVAVAALSTGNWVCSSDTQGGTYAALTAGDDAIDVVAGVCDGSGVVVANAARSAGTATGGIDPAGPTEASGTTIIFTCDHLDSRTATFTCVPPSFGAAVWSSDSSCPSGRRLATGLQRRRRAISAFRRVVPRPPSWPLCMVRLPATAQTQPPHFARSLATLHRVFSRGASAGQPFGAQVA